VSRDGRDLTLAVYPAVSVTGEVGLFHPAGVRWLGLSAMTASVCLMMGRAPLLGFLSRHPAAMQRMFEGLSTAAVQAAYSASGMAFENIGVRVATLLLYLANEYGESAPGGVRIRLRLSQGDLAAYVGASRENVNRALAALVGQGVVSQNSGHFHVRDLEALESAANPADEV
jgi:CRP-like cAMP-binding protein